MAATDVLIREWLSPGFRPVYWLDGDEEYYIDKLMNFAERNILDESQAGFNLTVFYGRDADWVSVVNACRRYPMFSEKQVVLLKEAQMLKDIDKIEPYLVQPLSSTLFIVGYKGKLDKRFKLSKTVATKASVHTFAKLRDEKLPEWISSMVKEKGFDIQPKAVHLLADHIGNDLSRLANEIDKISVNLSGKGKIDDDDIERYAGISKEYNVYELVAALAKKDLAGSLKIVMYFESNPKAGPMPVVMAALYGHFSKVYQLLAMKDHSDAALKPLFFFNPVAVKQAKETLKNYSAEQLEKVLLLLHQYNLKSIGIGAGNLGDGALLKELIVKMIRF